MKTVALSNSYANQEFFVVVEGVNYGFRLHTFRDMLYVDVTVGETVRVRSVRAIDRAWLFPFNIEGASGNFRFEHETEGTYPHWKDLGVKCKLVYYTDEEISALEGT